jgi:hypothetical protein
MQEWNVWEVKLGMKQGKKCMDMLSLPFIQDMYGKYRKGRFEVQVWMKGSSFTLLYLQIETLSSLCFVLSLSCLRPILKTIYGNICTRESSTTSDPFPSHNSPFNLVHIKRYWLILYEALRSISVNRSYSMIK